jgi:hypothetical protein
MTSFSNILKRDTARILHDGFWAEKNPVLPGLFL